MLKTVLYYLMFATTAIRLIDIVYLVVRGGSNLPVVVLAVSSAMVLYGLVLIGKKLAGSLRVKQIMLFYVVQAALVVFNLAYVAIVCPLQLSLPEIIAVGSFLDILLDAIVCYYCFKRIRASYVPAQTRKAVRQGSMNA